MSVEKQSTDSNDPSRQPPEPSESGGVPPDEPDSSIELFQAVYDQYWDHARHNEDQMWSYTRIWALILSGIFGALGAVEVSVNTKIGLALFGGLLSTLGFALVYTIRKPFLIYFWTADLIATEEFDIPSEYRRLSSEMGNELGKRVTVSFVLFTAYAIAATSLIATASHLYTQRLVESVESFVLSGILPLSVPALLGVLALIAFGGCYYKCWMVFKEICENVAEYNREAVSD